MPRGGIKKKKDVQDTKHQGGSVKTRTAGHYLGSVPGHRVLDHSCAPTWNLGMKGVKSPSVAITTRSKKKHEGPGKPVQGLPQGYQCPFTGQG